MPAPQPVRQPVRAAQLALLALFAGSTLLAAFLLWRRPQALAPESNAHGSSPAADSEAASPAALAPTAGAPAPAPASAPERAAATGPEAPPGVQAAPAEPEGRLALDLNAAPFALRLPLRSDLDAWEAAGLRHQLACTNAAGPKAASSRLDHGEHGPRLWALAPGPFELDIAWPGFLPLKGRFDLAGLRALAAPPPAATPERIEIRLQPAAALRLRCSDPAQPAGVRIAYRAQAARLDWALLGAPEQAWGERPLPVPSGAGEIWAEAPDGRRAVARLPALSAGQEFELELEFSAGQGGFVTLFETPSGRPVQQGKLFLICGTRPGDPNDVSIAGAANGIELGAEGRVRLPSLPAAAGHLALVDAGSGLLHQFPLLWPADAGRSFPVPAAGGLSARLRGGAALPQGTVVRARRPDRQDFDPLAAPHFFMFERQLPIPTAAVDAERRFSYARLAAGDWQLSLGLESAPHAGALELPLGSVRIVSEETQVLEFELPYAPECALEVEFILDGQPAAGQTLKLVPTAPPPEQQTLLKRPFVDAALVADAAGRAHIGLLPPGPYELHFAGATLARFDLAAGEQRRLSLAAEYGAALLTLVSPAGESLGVREIGWRRQGSTGWQRQRSDGLGRFYLRTLTGPHEVALLERGEGDPRTWREGPAGRFELRPGISELTLVLEPPP